MGHTHALSIEKQKRLDSLGWSFRRVREKTLKLDKQRKNEDHLVIVGYCLGKYDV